MKKILKSRLFFFILGILITIGIGTVFAYSYVAGDVGFTPTDTEWPVDNTSDALNDLYVTTKSSMYIDFYFSTEALSSSWNSRAISSVSLTGYSSKYRYIILRRIDKGSTCSSYDIFFYDSSWSNNVIPTVGQKYILSSYPIFYNTAVKTSSGGSCVMGYSIRLSRY